MKHLLAFLAIAATGCGADDGSSNGGTSSGSSKSSLTSVCSDYCEVQVGLSCDGTTAAGCKNGCDKAEDQSSQCKDSMSAGLACLVDNKQDFSCEDGEIELPSACSSKAARMAKDCPDVFGNASGGGSGSDDSESDGDDSESSNDSESGGDESESSDDSTGDDSCEYANDGTCDEPEYCDTGTDATDCG